MCVQVSCVAIGESGPRGRGRGAMCAHESAPRAAISSSAARLTPFGTGGAPSLGRRARARTLRRDALCHEWANVRPTKTHTNRPWRLITESIQPREVFFINNRLNLTLRHKYPSCRRKNTYVNKPRFKY